MLRQGQGSGVPGGGKHRLRSLIESSGDRRNEGLVILLPSPALLKIRSGSLLERQILRPHPSETPGGWEAASAFTGKPLKWEKH